MTLELLNKLKFLALQAAHLPADVTLEDEDAAMKALHRELAADTVLELIALASQSLVAHTDAEKTIDRPAASGDVRRDFEQAMMREDIIDEEVLMAFDGERYADDTANAAFKAWQAASAERAPVADVSELARENVELQKALAFWMPQVNQFMSDEMSQRIAQDAYLLIMDGNLPDAFKTAQELGWILPATEKVQGDAKMVCGNCMEPIPTTAMDTSSTCAPVVGLSDEQIKKLWQDDAMYNAHDMIKPYHYAFARRVLAAANGEQK